MSERDLFDVVSSGFHELVRLQEFVTACDWGFRSGIEADELVAATQTYAKVSRGRFTPLDDTSYAEHLKHARKVSETAQKEVMKGFPYISKLSIIGLWSILEATLDDLCVELLSRGNAWASMDVLRRVRGPIVEFALLRPEDQMNRLYGHLLQELRAPEKVGIGRFEGPLEQLGLGGSVPASVRGAVLEFVETRHVVVHKNGVADRQFCERCPWVPVRSGTPLELTMNHYEFFYSAVFAYFGDITIRLVKAGLKLDESDSSGWEVGASRWLRRKRQTESVLI